MKQSYSLFVRSPKAKLMLFVLFLTSILPCLPASAQTPYLVRDINPSTDVGSSSPSSFVQVGTSTFFAAYVPGEGYQLWKTDGTSPGTSLVTDRYFGEISNMTASNGKAFFVVDNNTLTEIFSISGTLIRSTADPELWTSDGTASGTKMLRKITYSGSTGMLADLNGVLFFASDDGAQGHALWKTDGTESGTVMVKAMPSQAAICPISTPCMSLSPSPASLTAVADTLFFVTGGTSAGLLSEGVEPSLWKSDGTETGTTVVKTGPSFSPANLTAANGTLYFTAADEVAATGIALWKTDGTPTNTAQVAGLGTATAQYFTDVNGKLYFEVSESTTGGSDTKLWKSDGTALGTIPLALMCDNATGATSCQTHSQYLAPVNDTVFFAAMGGLWKTDGTLEGTTQVADITPYELVSMNGAVYFEASDSVYGGELWTSDGTAQGTALVKDICPGVCSSLVGTMRPPLMGPLQPIPYFPAGDFLLGNSFVLNIRRLPALFVSNGKLYFSACEPVNACEPWTSDGTNAGTVLLKNIVLNTSSQERTAVDLNGTLVFPAYDGSGAKIWRTNGTDAGTLPGKTVTDVSGLSSQSVANGFVFFSNYDSTYGYELWKTDGTEAGTSIVKDIARENSDSVNCNFIDSYPSYLTAIGGTVYFAANDCAHGVELWKSDGTADGTVMVKDIAQGTPGSNPMYLTNFNGKLFFVTNDSGSAVWTSTETQSQTANLWKSDGTDAGTVVVASFSTDCSARPCLLSYPSQLIPSGNNLFFTVSGRLWKTDGTASGTAALSASQVLSPSQLTDVDGALFFWSSLALWKSDGTDAGTVVVKSFIPSQPGTSGVRVFSVGAMANVNGTLFFSFNNALWKSDGTADGTVMVKDIPASVLTNVNGTLYFAGHDANGTELWKSDGTDAGTVMVADINPGANGSFPTPLAISQGKLYFTANDGTHGAELWALNNAPTTVALTSSANPAVTSSSLTLTATLSSIFSGTPTGTVRFMDGTNEIGTATVNPSGVASLAMTSLTALTSGTHSIIAVYTGDSTFPAGTSAVLSQLILATAPDYTLSADSTSKTIRAGESATFVITATADDHFTGTITFSCGPLPTGATCTFTPRTLTPTHGSPTQTTLVISTSSRRAALDISASPFGGGITLAYLGGLGFFGSLLIGRSRRKPTTVLIFILAVLCVLGLASCGGGSSSSNNPSGTPSGSASVQITATATAGTGAVSTSPHQLAITVNVQ